MSQSAKRNPYYNIAGIDDPSLFFNRTEELQVLFNGFVSGSPQCGSIVGQRKVGKTSLVQHFPHFHKLECLPMASGRELTFVYFNCQRYPSALKGANQFIQKMVELIIEALPGTEHGFDDLKTVQETLHENVLDKLFYRLDGERRDIVVVFDEFEKAVSREGLISEGLFGVLRGYAQDVPGFAWVTCTRRMLRDLFEESFDKFEISEVLRKSESDFFNIAPTYPVGLFSQQDALELALLPARRHGVAFHESVVPMISSFGGVFPFYIQRACYHCFGADRYGKFGSNDILGKCLREALPFWSYYFENLTANERDTLLEISRSSGATGVSRQTRNLMEYALVYEDRSGAVWPFSEEFGKFVCNMSSKPTKVSVEKEKNSLSRENMENRDLLVDRVDLVDWKKDKAPPITANEIREHIIQRLFHWFLSRSRAVKVLVATAALVILFVIARLGVLGEQFHRMAQVLVPLELDWLDPSLPVVPLQLTFEVEDSNNRRPGKVGSSVENGNSVILTVSTGTRAWLTVFHVNRQGIHPVFGEGLDPLKVVQEKDYSVELDLDDTRGFQVYFAIAAASRFDFSSAIQPHLESVLPECRTKGPVTSRIKLMLPEKYTEKMIFFQSVDAGS